MKGSKVLSTLAAVAVLAGCGGQTAAGTKKTIHVEWRVQVAAPPAHALGRMWAQLATDLEQRSGGQIKLTVYFNDALQLPEKDQLSLVRDNVVQIGQVIGQFVEPTFPESNVLSLPGLLPGDTAQRAKVNEAVAPYFAKAISSQFGQVYLGICEADPRGVFTKSPIKTVSDLKGQKIRTSGAAETDLSTALGMIPVANIATPEVYPSMQSGAIQGAWGPNSYFQQGKFYEVGKYDYNAELGGSSVLITVNQSQYDKIGSDNQKILKQVVADNTRRCLQNVASDDQAAVSALQGQGVTVINPTPAEAGQLRSLAQSAQDRWLAKYPQARDVFNIAMKAVST